MNIFDALVCGEKWDYFVTLTAKHELSEAGARRVAVRWYNLMRDLGLRPKLFWVAEPHNGEKRGYHIHGLLQLDIRQSWVNVDKKALWRLLWDSAQVAIGGKEWRNKSGKIGRWHRIRLDFYKGQGAAKYTAKYMEKSQIDWDYFI